MVDFFSFKTHDVFINYGEPIPMIREEELGKETFVELVEDMAMEYMNDDLWHRIGTIGFSLESKGIEISIPRLTRVISDMTNEGRLERIVRGNVAFFRRLR
jgi:hypothetical protein